MAGARSGGLPANPLGWSVTTALRVLARDTLSVAGDPASSNDGWTLPDRGERPAMAAYPVPHRQLDRIPGGDLIDDLVARVEAVGREPGNRLARRSPRGVDLSRPAARRHGDIRRRRCRRRMPAPGRRPRHPRAPACRGRRQGDRGGVRSAASGSTVIVPPSRRDVRGTTITTTAGLVIRRPTPRRDEVRRRRPRR